MIIKVILKPLQIYNHNLVNTHTHHKYACMHTQTHMYVHKHAHAQSCMHTDTKTPPDFLITTKHATKRLARNPVIKFNEYFKNMSGSCTIKRTERFLKLVNSGLMHACTYVHTLSVTVLHQRKFSRSQRTD